MTPKSITFILVAIGLSGILCANEIPEAVDPATIVTQFAGKDLIKHPIGLAVTRDGKLLAVESHTHFRPGKYTGPTSDQIVWIQDTDGDGKADKRSVFYGESLSATMGIATNPVTGAIYVATRTGIVRLWDRDGDGVADPDEKDRRLVFFDLKGNFLDNGCSGLCFDDQGDLIFGIGSILGEPYTLKGSDGIGYADEGEGGNIWRCTKDGKNLRRFATGVWNPFGICHGPGGHVFATDNDPGSRPPCRLHHIVEGGDYGFQYRYGRSGQHPFVSWKAELPGTLPMICETGEAPCDILFHKGNLLVASWSNHQVEMYPLSWDKTHFSSERKLLLKGGQEFRPVALVVGGDDALYISDWVKQSYQVHGEGAIWRVENWAPTETHDIENVKFSEGKDPEDPWTFFRMISGEIPPANLSDQRKQVYELLSARFHEKGAVDKVIRRALSADQTSEELRMLAWKWIADKALVQFRDLAVQEIQNPPSHSLFHAALTAKGRIDGLKVMDADIQKLVADELHSNSPKARMSAFFLLDDRQKVAVDQLREIYKAGDEEMRSGVALSLRNHTEPENSKKFAAEIVAEDASAKVRALASLADPDGTQARPVESQDIGEYQFHKNCAKCHRVNGFGKKGGPDLSGIGVHGRDHILRSVRDPSSEIAPQFEAWKVEMADGTERVGFILGEKEGIHFYSDASGNEFEIDTANMVGRESLPISLMPPQLDKTMSEADFEHLVGWLVQLK